MQVTGRLCERVCDGFGYGARTASNSLQLAFGEGGRGRGKTNKGPRLRSYLPPRTSRHLD
jgi:hypothetical protein